MTHHIMRKRSVSLLRSATIGAGVALTVSACGHTAPAATHQTPPTKITPASLTLPLDPVTTPTSVAGKDGSTGWGLPTTRSGTGSATITVGMDARTRALYVEFRCSGPLPFRIANAHGQIITALGAGDSSAPTDHTCDPSGIYSAQVKSGSDVRSLRLVTAPTTRWVVKVWAVDKMRMVTVG